MGLLTKLKSLLGFEDDRSQVRRGESGVTIERDPDESAEPDARNESAVKGVDAGAEESGATETDEPEPSEAETGVSTEEPTTTPEDEQTAEETTEPAGAVESTTEAADPNRTAEDEPDSTTETTSESETETDGVEGIEEAEATDAADESETAAEAEDTTETEEETEPAEEAAAAGEPLEDVKGIGPAYAERLRDAGVADVAELAQADADRLADETDLSAKRISSWIERAQAR